MVADYIAIASIITTLSNVTIIVAIFLRMKSALGRFFLSKLSRLTRFLSPESSWDNINYVLVRTLLSFDSKWPRVKCCLFWKKKMFFDRISEVFFIRFKNRLEVILTSMEPDMFRMLFFIKNKENVML